MRTADASLPPEQFALWPGGAGSEIQLHPISARGDSLQKERGHVTASPTLGPFCFCCQWSVLLKKQLASVFLHCICGFNELPPGNASRGRRGFPRESGRLLHAVRWQRALPMVHRTRRHRCASPTLGKGDGRDGQPRARMGRPCLLLTPLRGHHTGITHRLQTVPSSARIPPDAGFSHQKGRSDTKKPFTGIPLPSLPDALWFQTKCLKCCYEGKPSFGCNVFWISCFKSLNTSLNFTFLNKGIRGLPFSTKQTRLSTSCSCYSTLTWLKILFLNRIPFR